MAPVEICQVCLTVEPDVPFDVSVILAEFECSIRELVATVGGIVISEQGNHPKIICGICLKDLSSTFRVRRQENNQISEETSLDEDKPVIKCKHGMKLEAKDEDHLAKQKAITNEQSKHRNDGSVGNKYPQRMWKCFTCYRMFADKKKLFEHLRCHQRPIHSCRNGFKIFKYPDELMHHRHRSHNHWNDFDRRRSKYRYHKMENW